MKKIGFALIGCGAIGKMHANIIATTENLTLIAVCDNNELSAKELSQTYSCKCYTDYNKMLQDTDIEVVTICLPSGLHYPATMAAMNAQKHVICEKPIDVDVSKAREMVALGKKNNLLFSVIFQHRYDEAIIALRKAVNDGLMGKLLWGASRTIWYRDDEYYSNPWRGTWASDGGGALINQSIHYIDLLLSFLGPVKSVNGKCRKVLHNGIETEDLGVANIEFENGTIGTIEGSTACYPGLYAELCIFGEKGSAVIRNDQLFFYDFKDGKKEFMDKLLEVKIDDKSRVTASVPDDSHRRQYDDFINSYLTGAELTTTGEDALMSLELIKAIYKSSDEKRELYIEK